MGAFPSCEQFALGHESREAELRENTTSRPLYLMDSADPILPTEADGGSDGPHASGPPPPPSDTFPPILSNEVLPDALRSSPVVDNLPPSHTLELGNSTSGDLREAPPVSTQPWSSLEFREHQAEHAPSISGRVPEECAPVVTSNAYACANYVSFTNGSSEQHTGASRQLALEDEPPIGSEGAGQSQRGSTASAAEREEDQVSPSGSRQRSTAAAAPAPAPLESSCSSRGWGPGDCPRSQGGPPGQLIETTLASSVAARPAMEAGPSRAAGQLGGQRCGANRSDPESLGPQPSGITVEAVEVAKLKAKEWQFQIKVEMKLVGKEIKRIQKEEGRLQKKITAEAQKGSSPQQVEELAKSIVQARTAAARLEKTLSSLHAVDLHLSTALASMTTKASLQLSRDLMCEMGRLVQTQEVGSAVEALHHEISQYASTEAETDEVQRDQDEQAEADEEVRRVLEEVELEKIRLLESTKPGATPHAAASAITAARHSSGHGPRHRAA